MLIIRQDQLDALRQTALVDFANEMLAHSKAFSPKLSEVLGDEQMTVSLHQAMTKAETFGFSFRGPIRLFVEMMFLYGSSFDADPQYPWAGVILRSPGEQMQRAERLYQCVLQYQENVSGPDGANTRKALKELSALTEKPLPNVSGEFETSMLAEMTSVFPQKAAYVGNDGLHRLIRNAADEASTYCFPSVRGGRLMCALKYAFGIGCTNDPLYPWISRTLQDDRIANPIARMDRLERKAMTWLEHVLASFPEGTLP